MNKFTLVLIVGLIVFLGFYGYQEIRSHVTVSDFTITAEPQFVPISDNGSGYVHIEAIAP